MKYCNISLTTLLLAPLVTLNGAKVTKPPTRPNILFILADDLGQRDIGIYGSSFYETPNIDRLARDGAIFTNAYAAASICSPTRSSILTGQYPARTHNTEYFGGPNGFDKGIPTDYLPSRDGRFILSWTNHSRFPLLPAPYLECLSASHTTLAETLKAEGYRTMHAGKWHLGPEGSWPEDHGFDVNRGGHSSGGPYGGEKYFSPYGNPRLTNGPEGEHIADRLAEECSKFMEANKDKPFYISLWFYDVHTPIMARPELIKKYEAKRLKLGLKPAFISEPPQQVRQIQEHAVYAAMVETMDNAVGQVLAKLDELGLRENTIVIFTSDNGGLSTSSDGSPTSNLPFRAGKGWLYEGGLREPLLISYPPLVKPGTVINTPVISTDFYPTLLDFVGIPQNPQQTLDGISFVPLFRNRKIKRSQLFWHYPHYSNQGGKPSGAIREGDWKLIEWFEDGRLELYNLAVDIGEQDNLTRKYPDKVKDLHEKLVTWRKNTQAIMPDPNPNSKTR